MSAYESVSSLDTQLAYANKQWEELGIAFAEGDTAAGDAAIKAFKRREELGRQSAERNKL